MKYEIWTPPDERLTQAYKFTIDLFRSNSPRTEEVLELIRDAARCRDCVLILGESGTGKELVAQAIHNLCEETREGPFVPVNPTSLSPTLWESELFGHAEGAYSGATKAHPGYFGLARRGTLLLDEAGHLTGERASSLLRVFTDWKYKPVGGTQQQVECRLVAATDADLEAMAQPGGTYSPQLLWRLSKLTIPLPALRERPMDIVPSFAGFYAAECEKRQHAPQELTEEVARFLQEHTWPGNFRELSKLAGDAARRGLHAAMEEVRRRQAASGTVPPPVLRPGEVERCTDVIVKHTAGLYRTYNGDVGRIADAIGRCVATVYKWIAIARKRGWL